MELVVPNFYIPCAEGHVEPFKVEPDFPILHKFLRNRVMELEWKERDRRIFLEEQARREREKKSNAR